MISSAAHLAAAIFSVSVDLVSTHQSLSKMLSLRLSAVPFGTKDIGQYCTQGVTVGSLADKKSRAKIHRCPLWSKSGQKPAKLICPLSANSYDVAAVPQWPRSARRRATSK